MILVRCKNVNEITKEKLTIGKKYWLDIDSAYTDTNGTCIAEIYSNNDKDTFLCKVNQSDFEVVDRYLECGGSVTGYINTSTTFLLIDIINWALRQERSKEADNILKYINDMGLNKDENMYKDFIIKHTPVRQFLNKYIEENYMKYLGYSVECVE